MIRFAGRQFRTQAAVALGGLIVLAAVLLLTGPHVVDLYNRMIATCATRGDCATTTAAFIRTHSSLRMWLGILVIVTPGIIGIFWGAPLVARELESGTFRLAWTQSVTRTRWLAAKLAVVGGVGVVATGLLTLMVTWWASPLDRVRMGRFDIFDQRAIVPLGHTAFAFMLGVVAGVVLRRVLPAMATTFVAFVVARLAFVEWVRPRLMAPAHRIFALDPTSTGYGSSGGPATLQPNPPNIPNVWILSTHVADKLGRPLTARFVASTCPRLGAGEPPPVGAATHGPVPAEAQHVLQDCVTKVGATFHGVVTYQPADRYWTFQWFELAIFLAGAAVLTAFCVWWVRRRL